MAVDSKSSIEGDKKVPATDPMAAARAARSTNRKARPTLNEKQKFVISTARSAKKAAQIVIDRTERGDELSPEVVNACAQLTATCGSLLLG